MSYGLVQAGINVIAGIDNDITCKETYEVNIPKSKFIHTDIKKFKTKDLQKEINIKKNDDNLIFVGCSPCQFWTIINTIKKRSAQSKNLLSDFKRFVNYYDPGYVVVENVPGILQKRNESGLDDFIQCLKKRGYKVSYQIINLNHYGVPQNRKRFSLIATRVNEEEIFPEPDIDKFPTVEDFIGEYNGFPKIKAGHHDSSIYMHTTAGLSKINLERIRKTKKNGGSRLDWAKTNLQLETYKKRNNNSFSDIYGRMTWNKPAPTITTKFFSTSNGRFGHPEEDRAISLREGATLQTFPKDFIFKTNSIASTAKIIGNAVPPEYAKRIGLAILKSK